MYPKEYERVILRLFKAASRCWKPPILRERTSWVIAYDYGGGGGAFLMQSWAWANHFSELSEYPSTSLCVQCIHCMSRAREKNVITRQPQINRGAYSIPARVGRRRCFRLAKQSTTYYQTVQWHLSTLPRKAKLGCRIVPQNCRGAAHSTTPQGKRRTKQNSGSSRFKTLRYLIWLEERFPVHGWDGSPRYTDIERRPMLIGLRGNARRLKCLSFPTPSCRTQSWRRRRCRG